MPYMSHSVGVRYKVQGQLSSPLIRSRNVADSDAARASATSKSRLVCLSGIRVSSDDTEMYPGGLCRRLNFECLYRDASPVRKDQTLMHILSSLERLETKFEDLTVDTSFLSRSVSLKA